MSTSLRDQAYEYIRDKLFSRELAPGDMVSPRQLAKEMGISFTPAREAVTALTNEGLLVCFPRRGVFVSKISREELVDLYDCREALECHCAHKISGRLDTDQFAELSSIHDRMLHIYETTQNGFPVEETRALSEQWINLDMELHKTILRFGGNHRAILLVQELRDKMNLFGHVTKMTPEHLKPGLDDHRQIIDALYHGQTGLACRTLKTHFKNGCKNAIEHYEYSRMRR